MRLLRLLALAILTSCATGHMPPPAHAGDKDARLVDHIWYNPRPELWRNSGWYRAFTDMATPMRVVISSDRSACIMPDFDVNEPRPGEYYRCTAPWRFLSGTILRP